MLKADHIAALGSGATRHARLRHGPPAPCGRRAARSGRSTSSLNDGAWLGEGLATDAGVRAAYHAMRRDGYYSECSNSFTLGFYRVPAQRERALDEVAS